MPEQTEGTRVGDVPSHLIEWLGPEGVIVLLCVGAMVLTVRSKSFRRAEIRVARSALRGAWRGLKRLARALRGIRTLGATGEERRIMGRLSPVHWKAHAKKRGLDGTLTGPPRLTKSGIVCSVRLDDTWTLPKFRSAQENIRALLGLRTDLRMSIDPGKRGGWALVTVRTRSAADGIPMKWTPDHQGIGVDEVTGEIVDVPLEGTHKLIAGVTNMGKSVAWRPWMMRAVADPLWAGILLDPKRLEARRWHGKIRTEGHQRGSNEEVRQAVYDGIRELVATMQYRQEVADVTQWVPTPEHPNLLVVIEEGRQVVQMSKDKRWADVLDLIDDLYTLARATGIWIVWATQYPSRTNGGVTAMVSENSLTVMCLTVDGPVSDRVVFGENAGRDGWEPSRLGGQKGRALIRHESRDPSPVRVWWVTDEVVSDLPDVVPWSGPDRPESGGQAPEQPAPGPSVRPVSTVKEPPPATVDGIPDDLVSAVWGLSVRDCVLSVLSESGCPMGVREIADRIGRSVSGVHKELGRLVADGSVVQGADKKYGVAEDTESCFN